jgi:hypothetical protein
MTKALCYVLAGVLFLLDVVIDGVAIAYQVLWPIAVGAVLITGAYMVIKWDAWRGNWGRRPRRSATTS